MRRFTMCTDVALVVGAGAVAMGQTRITTVDEYAKVMKSNAQIGGAMNKALGSAWYADARALLVTLRENFVRLQGFWTLTKREFGFNQSHFAVQSVWIRSGMRLE